MASEKMLDLSEQVTGVKVQIGMYVGHSPTQNFSLIRNVCVFCATTDRALSHISSLILFFFGCESMSSVVQEPITTWRSAVVLGGRMDAQSLLGRHVKPAKAMVFLVVSFGRGVVGILLPWETQTSLLVLESLCTQVSSCTNEFDP